MMSEHESKVYGLDLIPLPEGAYPLGAVVLVKYMDSEGETQYSQRFTPGILIPESLGMCELASDQMRSDAAGGFERVDWDEDDDPDG